jgi:uncharacterized small protein (DUF1192 family)
MGRDRAAYMREYRARRKTKVTDMTTVPGRIAAAFDIAKAEMRIAQLEEEVRHLKAELAKRQPTHELDALTSLREPATLPVRGQFNTRPFTPVPKTRSR